MDILPHDNVSQLPIQRPDRDPGLSRDIPDADHFVRVLDDKYVAEFIGAEGFYYRGCAPKVKLWFWIADRDHKGQRVPAYCNVKSLECRRGQHVRRPRFTVGWRADLTLYLAILFPERYSHDELPKVIPELDMMQRKILIQTRTSRTNHKGQERPDVLHNSVVDAILGWAE